MPPRPPNRAGLVLIGALGGLFVVALVLWLYLRLAQVGQVEREVAARLNLPPGTLELEEISDEGRLRISLRDVLLVGDAGDTVAAAPRVTLWFDPSELSGDGPLVFSDVVLEEPDLRLVQLPAGGWNILRALRLEAGGREVAGVTPGDRSCSPISGWRADASRSRFPASRRIRPPSQAAWPFHAGSSGG